ncbi:MAG: fasciclin domain-containing protein [Thiohalocapsa sp.]
MSIRNATVATAIMLGLGLNAASIKNAVAGDGCGRVNAAHGNPDFNAGAMQQPGALMPSRTPYAASSMQHLPIRPAMYWGAQAPQVVKTGMTADDGGASGDIVDVAVSAGSFDTLVAAVKAAGLVETLKGEGPFTVFAPSDEAFAKIPKEQLDALLLDKDALIAVLTYHVVAGRVMAADVVGLDSATSVQGSSITIDTSDGVKVDGANIVMTDIEASNGVIHVIDTVIIPSS